MPSDTRIPAIARLRALPKAEVHAHLEGCFEPAVLEQWAAQAGVAMPRPRERLLQFEGLADFLHFLDWACGLASTRWVRTGRVGLRVRGAVLATPGLGLVAAGETTMGGKA